MLRFDPRSVDLQDFIQKAAERPTAGDVLGSNLRLPPASFSNHRNELPQRELLVRWRAFDCITQIFGVLEAACSQQAGNEKRHLPLEEVRGLAVHSRKPG